MSAHAALPMRTACSFLAASVKPRNLLGRVLSERLFLFYAQSGRKRKLHYSTARLIPQILTGEKGFAIMPVTRVSGELPASVVQVDNIYLFNLMLEGWRRRRPSTAGARDAVRFPFAACSKNGHQQRRTGAAKGWVYDESISPTEVVFDGSPQRYALIINQFEEITHRAPAPLERTRGVFPPA